MTRPDFKQFKDLAGSGNLIPVYREILADSDTPVSAFQKIDDGRYSFLLESVEGGEKWARFSFLASRPSIIIKSFGSSVEVIRKGKKEICSFSRDPLEVVREVLSEYQPVPNP